jgi:hypothetical protein
MEESVRDQILDFIDAARERREVDALLGRLGPVRVR